jgi:hypothetical protein
MLNTINRIDSFQLLLISRVLLGENVEKRGNTAKVHHFAYDVRIPVGTSIVYASDSTVCTCCVFILQKKSDVNAL